MLLEPRLLDRACRQLEVRLLVLFGSHPPGGLTPRPQSDVDLAVAFERDARPPSFHQLFDALADAFPDHTPDPVRLADADPLFRWEIMDRGVLLYGDIDDFLEHRAFAYRDYDDTADPRSGLQIQPAPSTMIMPGSPHAKAAKRVIPDSTDQGAQSA